MPFRSKPKGIWANFDTECARCQDDLTVTNGKPEPHQCEAEEGSQS